jgi:kinesin family protein 6/9
MQRKAVTVCVRTRPTANFAQENITINEDVNSIGVRTSSGYKGTGPNNAKSAWNFKYDRVLMNSTQEGTYSSECSRIVESVVEGYNATIFAYGQTGAGKTFTMIGNTADFEQRGVTPRALNHLFREIEVRTDVDFTISATYLEIYNERIFDLLDDVTNENQTSDYQIIEDKSGATKVKGLTQVPVTSEEGALNLLFKGELGRTTASHLLNKRSNRSHCVFTLHIEQRSKLGGSENIKISKLNLVDLAGSERLKKTGADTDPATKRESMYINKSLSYLEQVVVALTTKSRTHIPYRQTKLTNILKDSLGGNCMTLMIACIWVEPTHLEETISTLQLAQRMMKVKNSTKLNQRQDPALLLKKYERIIKELRQELVMHDALSERVGIVYEEFTPEQISDIKREVNEFLSAPKQRDEEIITVSSVKQIREVFKEFKRVHIEQQQELEYTRQHHGALTTAGTSGGNEAGGGEGGSVTSTRGNTASGQQVGHLKDDNGFGLGTAASSARPQALDHPAGLSGNMSANVEGNIGISNNATIVGAADNNQIQDQTIPADKNKAYSMFKESIAPDLRDELARLNAIVRGQ